MKLLSLKESDERKLKSALSEMKTLHEQLSAKYSLRNDLIEITDRRYTLRAQLEEELEKIRTEQVEARRTSDSINKIKSTLEKQLAHISDVQARLTESEGGDSAYSEFMKLTDDENIEELSKKTSSISDLHEEIFNQVDGAESQADRIREEMRLISNWHTRHFTTHEETGESALDEIERKANEINEYYDKFFSESDEEDSRIAQIERKLRKIEKFHERIYGNEKNNTPSLSDELSTRLENLESVEKKAISVINLSSEAGLAGGFVVKVKEAKKGQLISLSIFVAAAISIFVINTLTFDISDFKTIDWKSFLFKALINSPLIWIATIANLNLNRFSRLEQEYSHKESLAKSYERYKDEIEQLKSLGADGAEELKIKLIQINLDAFRVNPAKSLDKSSAENQAKTEILKQNPRIDEEMSEE